MSYHSATLAIRGTRDSRIIKLWCTDQLKIDVENLISVFEMLDGEMKKRILILSEFTYLNNFYKNTEIIYDIHVWQKIVQARRQQPRNKSISENLSDFFKNH